MRSEMRIVNSSGNFPLAKKYEESSTGGFKLCQSLSTDPMTHTGGASRTGLQLECTVVDDGLILFTISLVFWDFIDKLDCGSRRCIYLNNALDRLLERQQYPGTPGLQYCTLSVVIIENQWKWYLYAYYIARKDDSICLEDYRHCTKPLDSEHRRRETGACSLLMLLFISTFHFTIGEEEYIAEKASTV